MADEESTPSEEEVTSDPEADLESMTVDLTDDESDDESQEESEEEAESEDTTEEADESTEEEQASPEPEAKDAPVDDVKARNREMAEKRLAAKAEREAQLKQQQADYVAEADADDPRDAAVRQLQVDAYNNKVDSNTNKLTNGYERALKDFDILRSDDPVIQAEVNSAVDDFQARYVTIDQFGNPTEVAADLYTHLQSKADSIAKLTGIRESKQETSKAKEKSKVLSVPSRAPKTAKSNDLMEGFDEEAGRY